MDATTEAVQRGKRGRGMTREEAIQGLKDILEEATSDKDAVCYVTSEDAEALNMAIEALSAEAVPQSEKYRKGFEDAKRAFLIEYARESENMRKRNAQLEVMLNAQKAISARPQGEWKIDEYGIYHCPYCNAINNTVYKSFCPNCGADMRGGTE